MRPSVLLAWCLLTLSARAESLDFSRDVRPILSRHCFKCHGPDESKRKAKLRLDVRDGALRVIKPGKPDDSELMRRILSTEETEVMPPPAVKNPLRPADRDILRRWITEGAEYKPHWAFVAPRQTPPPQIRNPKIEIRNPIDAFVFSRLEKEGLKPSPPADRYTLIRRLYLDLIGMPPIIEETDAFVKDSSPDAVEKVVDRL